MSTLLETLLVELLHWCQGRPGARHCHRVELPVTTAQGQGIIRLDMLEGELLVTGHWLRFHLRLRSDQLLFLLYQNCAAWESGRVLELPLLRQPFPLSDPEFPDNVYSYLRRLTGDST